jgi:hypothetical protein
LNAPSRTDRLVTPLVFFGLAVVVWVGTRGPGALLDLFEHGHWLAPASDMLAGKVPYRDTFPMHGFLSDGGLDYVLFRLFGASYRLSLDARHFVESFFHPAIFLVAAAAVRRPVIAALAIALNLGMSIAVIADRPVLPLLSLAAFLWAIGEERSKPRAFAAGLLGGLGLLYALDFGTFVLIAELATLAACRLFSRGGNVPPIRAAWYFLGLGAVLVPWLAILAAVGALGSFLKVSFVDLPRLFESTWGLHFPAPWELIREWMQGHPYYAEGVPISPAVAKRFYLAPVFGVLGIGLGLWTWRKQKQAIPALRLLVLSLACLGFYRYVVFRFHLAAGNALTGPLFLLLLVTVFEFSGRRRRVAVALSVVGVLAAFAMNGPARLLTVFRNAAAYRARTTPPASMVALTVPRGGGIRVPRDAEKNLRELVGFIDAHAPTGAPILDLSNRPALYFFARRVNPTRFVDVPPMATFEDEVLRDVQRNRPALVFLESGTWLDAIDGIPNSRRIPRVWAWVLENYPVRVKVAGSTIALPRTRWISRLSE